MSRRENKRVDHGRRRRRERVVREKILYETLKKKKNIAALCSLLRNGCKKETKYAEAVQEKLGS